MRSAVIGTALGPSRVREVLVPVARGGAAVASRAISTGRNRRARALATGALILAKAVEALDDDLGSMLVSALEMRQDLADAAWRSQFRPHTPVVVDLFEVTSVPVTAKAELSVLVNEVVQATVTATLEVEFGLAGLQVEIRGGWLTGIVGQQSVTATLTVDTLRIGPGPAARVDHKLAESERATEWQPVWLPRPIPLLAPPR